MNMLSKLGAAAGAITAVILLWVTLDIATGKDIKRLDCKYAPSAVAAFNVQRQNLLVIKPADTPESQNAWKALIDQADRDLNAAIDHKIKCMGQ